jgi:hypothetical protein
MKLFALTFMAFAIGVLAGLGMSVALTPAPSDIETKLREDLAKAKGISTELGSCQQRVTTLEKAKEDREKRLYSYFSLGISRKDLIAALEGTGMPGRREPIFSEKDDAWVGAGSVWTSNDGRVEISAWGKNENLVGFAAKVQLSVGHTDAQMECIRSMLLLVDPNWKSGDLANFLKEALELDRPTGMELSIAHNGCRVSIQIDRSLAMALLEVSLH